MSRTSRPVCPRRAATSASMRSRMRGWVIALSRWRATASAKMVAASLPRLRRPSGMALLGPNENRFDDIPERIRGVLSYVGLHTRMFRNLYSGILHFFIFWGFVILLTAILQAFGEGIIPGFSLAPVGGNTWIAFLQDLFGVLVLVGVVMALANRLIIRPRQFHESNEADALIILVLLATIMVGRLGQNAARIAQGGDPSVAWRPAP